jgi:hypothetical protein
MSKFTYDVTIPNRGTFEVKSDTELTDQQAYDYALQSMPSRTTGEELVRSLGITARGVAPVATGAAIGAPFGPVGMLAGTIALPAAELATQAANVALPQQYQIPSPAGAVENLMTRIGLPQAETTAERMAQSAAGALSSVGGQIATLPTLARTATTDLGRRISEMLSQSSGRQIAAAAPSAAVAQGVGEEFGPLAGAGAGMATGAAFGVGARPRVGPTAEDLAAKSSQLFERAKESGVMFNAPKFANKMTGVMNSLRDEGYEAGSAYPKLDIAFNRLTDPATPKDFTGLANLRKTIQAAQASIDPTERRLATILKDQFDEYVSSAPSSDILGANTKTGTEIWKQARGEYSKLMKADVFETMLENAKLDGASKFTASGAENSMAQQLRQLAKNDKKMRLFTKSEQAEINAVAKGTSAQNLLKFFGRFAPTSPVTFGVGAGVYALEPTVGTALAVGSGLSRLGATALRRQSVERLADMMRLGAPVPKQIPVPAITGGRGLISPQVPLDVTSEQLQQIYGQ